MAELPGSVVVVMGVSGTGKTTVGRMLAGRLEWSFADADDFHSAANVDRMQRGIALSDADRSAWLETLAARVEEWQRLGQPAVLACSALKRGYRSAIGVGLPGIRVVYLKADQALIASRLARRKGHFMPASLLQSQFDALEEPSDAEHAIVVAAAQPLDAIVEAIVSALQPGRPGGATPRSP